MQSRYGARRDPAHTVAQMALAGGGLVDHTPNTNLWNQLAWFVNPVNGSDSNDGKTAATAIKRVREIVRRWGTPEPTISAGLVAINILNNLLTDDAIDIYPSTASLGGIRIAGSLTAVAGIPTKVAAVTAQNTATAQRLTITAGAIDWTPFINGFVFDQTTGVYCWIVAAPAAGKFVVTQPLQSAVPVGAGDNPFPAAGTIALGDSFVVYTLPTAYLARFGCKNINSSAQTNVQQSLCHLNILDSFGAVGAQVVGQGVVAECLFQASTFWKAVAGDVFATNNLVTTGSLGAGSGEMSLTGVQWTGGALLNENINDYGQNFYDGNVYIDGKFISKNGGASRWAFVSSNRANQCVPTVSDSGGGFSALLITPSVSVYAGSTIWGTMALIAQAGGRILKEPAASTSWANTLKNTGGLEIGGLATAFAFDPSVHAYTAAIALTPANLDLTIGGGGFGGSAHRPEIDAHFIQSDAAQA